MTRRVGVCHVTGTVKWTGTAADLVAAWDKVMNLDRFDLARS